MGVFSKTPYTNFHELNLNWIIKKIKEVAADNTFLKQFFKTIEDEHILGVVTDVTENNDNTVKTDYWNEDTQLMDDYTVYNKTGTDMAISGAVSPIATRVTNAEGRLDDAEDDITSLQSGKLDKTAMQTILLASGDTILAKIQALPDNCDAMIIQNSLAISDAPVTTTNNFIYTVRKYNSSRTDIEAVEVSSGVAHEKYYCAYIGTGSLTWREVATQSDVGQIFSVDTNGKTITLGSSYRGVMFVIASSVTACGLYLIFSSGSSGVAARAVAESDRITLTYNTGTMTITASTGTVTIWLKTISNTLPTIS